MGYANALLNSKYMGSIGSTQPVLLKLIFVVHAISTHALVRPFCLLSSLYYDPNEAESTQII